MKTTTREIKKSHVTSVPAGDYAAECQEGRRRGGALLAVMRANQAPCMLFHEIEKMRDSDEPRGVKVGFAQVIGAAAMRGTAS